jgi:hypothetical protein
LPKQRVGSRGRDTPRSPRRDRSSLSHTYWRQGRSFSSDQWSGSRRTGSSRSGLGQSSAVDRRA